MSFSHQNQLSLAVTFFKRRVVRYKYYHNHWYQSACWTLSHSIGNSVIFAHFVQLNFTPDSVCVQNILDIYCTLQLFLVLLSSFLPSLASLFVFLVYRLVPELFEANELFFASSSLSAKVNTTISGNVSLYLLSTLYIR